MGTGSVVCAEAWLATQDNPGLAACSFPHLACSLIHRKDRTQAHVGKEGQDAH